MAKKKSTARHSSSDKKVRVRTKEQPQLALDEMRHFLDDMRIHVAMISKELAGLNDRIQFIQECLDKFASPKEENPPVGKRELVLKMGVEGGGVDIYRSSIGREKWQYHVDGCSMFIDKNDSEDWRSWQKQGFSSFYEAIRNATQSTPLVWFYPDHVHSDYRDIVWKEVLHSDSNETEFDHHNLEVWRKLCGVMF